MAELKADVAELKGDIARMSGQIANLIGHGYETQAIEGSRGLVRRHLGMERAMGSIPVRGRIVHQGERRRLSVRYGPLADVAALLRHCSLSDDDIEQIRARGHNQLGFRAPAAPFVSFLGWAHILLTGECEYRWAKRR